MGLDIPVFQAYQGTEPPRFASQAELECAKVLDYYGVPWLYEPRTFVLERGEDGRVTEAFAPDFYLPQQDLERLYRDVDFAWALDLEHTDHNSRWLMPCRFYEAGHFGVPCLAVHGFEIGTTIESHRIGWTFDAPLEESMARFFERLTVADYERIRGRLRSVPRSMFVAGDDVAQLCTMLGRSEA